MYQHGLDLTQIWEMICLLRLLRVVAVALVHVGEAAHGLIALEVLKPLWRCRHVSVGMLHAESVMLLPLAACGSKSFPVSFLSRCL